MQCVVEKFCLGGGSWVLSVKFQVFSGGGIVGDPELGEFRETELFALGPRENSWQSLVMNANPWPPSDPDVGAKVFPFGPCSLSWLLGGASNVT